MGGPPNGAYAAMSIDAVPGQHYTRGWSRTRGRQRPDAVPERVSREVSAPSGYRVLTCLERDPPARVNLLVPIVSRRRRYVIRKLSRPHETMALVVQHH